MRIIKIAVFASGSGSNAIKLLDYFEKSTQIKVDLILTNNKDAGVLKKTKNRVKQIVIDNQEAKDGLFLNEIMQEHSIHYIVLAGYLRIIPEALIQNFPFHIINIHPALLPKYGGKGMYGMHVHQAVFENKEQESGITIHLVNSKYDEGKVLAQYKVSISDGDTPETIQQKVLKVEHEYFSKTVEDYILKTEKIRIR